MFKQTRQDLALFYSTIGRPSIDREQMTRMLWIGYCYLTPLCPAPFVMPWGRGWPAASVTSMSNAGGFVLLVLHPGNVPGTPQRPIPSFPNFGIEIADRIEAVMSAIGMAWPCFRPLQAKLGRVLERRATRNRR